MTIRSNVTRLGIVSMTCFAIAVAAPAQAGDHRGAPAAGTMSHTETAGHQAAYGTAPLRREIKKTTETVRGPDGVETIVNTTYVTKPGGAPVHHGGYTSHGYYPAGPQGAVFSREQWLAECRRRTDSIDDNDEKGGIIGGLLGAITGGIIGNRVADSERLGGTLIGAGVGGLAGLAIGSLIDSAGKDDDGDYDCEAALDGYLTQHDGGFSHAVPGHGYGYGYAHPTAHYGASYGYGSYYAGCACQPQITYIPVQYHQRQRVIVRETVTEEIIPGKVRHIPGKYIKTETKVVPAPSPKPRPVKTYAPQPVKMIKY